MPDTTINIVLFGLSLLVPNTDLPTSGMTAVMPDSTAQQVSSDGCRIPRHEPVLLTKGAAFVESQLAKQSSFRKDLLDRDGYDGGWNLRGLEVRFRLYERNLNKPDRCETQGEPLPVRFDMDPHDNDGDGVWPDKAGASKIGWVWKGSDEFQERGVAVSCLTGSRRACPVAARLIVTNGSVRVCRLAAIQTGDPNVPLAKRDYLQGFQSQEQGDGAAAMGRSRPLPTAVRIAMTAAKASVLVVMTKGLEGTTSEEFLRVCPTGDRDQIWIGNTPLGTHSHQSGYCAKHDVDRHFELFYLLEEPDDQATKPKLAEDREVPKATGRRKAKLADLLQPEQDCFVPALFLDGVGHVPELTAVCGKGQGKPNWAAGRD
jgi:hypothetical protein